jgi:hypothetical protein
MNVSPATPNHREGGVICFLAINVLSVGLLLGFGVSELAILVCLWDGGKTDGKEVGRIGM